MKKHVRNEKGITLVEILAVLVIGGIVMALIISISSNGGNQYNSQTINSEELNDVRYAAKVVTKEIRLAERIGWDGTNLTIGTDSPLKLSKNSETILKDGRPLITTIKITELSLADRKLNISMSSINRDSKKTKTIKTEIYIREGVIID